MIYKGINMKNLTGEELNFWNALVNDYEIRKEKSFIKTMFLSSLNNNNKIEIKLHKLFDNSYEEVFSQSDLLLSSIDSCIVGKYKDTFWGTDSEGEIYGMGCEIQNLPYLLLDRLGDINDITSIKNYFNNVLEIDYLIYLQEYKNFCKSFGLEYKGDTNLIEKQSEKFNQLLDDLDSR